MSNLPGQNSETVIGTDASFKGEMTFEGSMRIEGKFDGKLATKGRLTLGKTAQLSGEIQVGTALIDGNLKGNILAVDKIDLTASAHVQGDLRAPKLVVAEGATLVGNVTISPDAVRGSVERDALLGSTAAPVPAMKR